MVRDPDVLVRVPDLRRVAADLPIGSEGIYYVGGERYGILGPNQPPRDQPGLWCQWTPTEDAAGVEWDGQEKFYSYIGWLKYIIEHFLVRWGYTMNGEVTWEGESPDDIGSIRVINNRVFAGNPPVVPPLLEIASALEG